MINTQNQPDTKRAPNVLRILAGLHAGASRPLAEREMILVGSGEDCEIVLADNGVARHHALINLLGDVSSLRALDAPLRVDGQALNPGDPVELKPFQRIQIGDAEIAFGPEAQEGWASVDGSGLGAAASRVKSASMRRLPTIAALAALSLASLAIFAAVMPSRSKPVDVAAELKAVAAQYHVANPKIQDDAGVLTLVGTVNDQATSDRISKQLTDRGVTPSLQLRTGEQIAADVAEVLRASDLFRGQETAIETHYKGNGVVQVDGRIANRDALEQATHSRAMRDVKGLTRIELDDGGNARPMAKAAADGTPAPQVAAAPLRIVAMTVGRPGKRDAHITALDGREFKVSEVVPGLGRLTFIGEVTQVMDDSGMLHPVKIEPVTAQELAEAADRQATLDAQAQQLATQAAAAPAATSGGIAKSTVPPVSAGKPGPVSPAPVSKDVAQASPAPPAKKI